MERGILGTPSYETIALLNIEGANGTWHAHALAIVQVVLRPNRNQDNGSTNGTKMAAPGFHPASLSMKSRYLVAIYHITWNRTASRLPAVPPPLVRLHSCEEYRISPQPHHIQPIVSESPCKNNFINHTIQVGQANNFAEANSGVPPERQCQGIRSGSRVATCPNLQDR